MQIVWLLSVALSVACPLDAQMPVDQATLRLQNRQLERESNESRKEPQPDARKGIEEYLRMADDERLLRAAFGLRPDTIYLLTDGDFPEAKAVLDCIHGLNAEHRARINTVGFIDESDDQGACAAVLRRIAREGGGSCRLVTEPEAFWN